MEFLVDVEDTIFENHYSSVVENYVYNVIQMTTSLDNARLLMYDNIQQWYTEVVTRIRARIAGQTTVVPRGTSVSLGTRDTLGTVSEIDARYESIVTDMIGNLNVNENHLADIEQHVARVATSMYKCSLIIIDNEEYNKSIRRVKRPRISA